MASIASRVSDNIGLVIDELDKYEKDLEKIAEVSDFEGKKLEQLCKDHPKNLWFFKSRANDLKNLEEFLDIEYAKIESELWRHYNEKVQIKLSTSDIKMYINSDNEIISYKKIMSEVKNIRCRFDAAVEAVEAMGWQISYIVKLRVAMMEEALL